MSPLAGRSRGSFANADEVAAAIDSQVMSMYRVHPTNVAAYRMQQERLPPGFTDDAGLAGAEHAMRERLAGLPPEHHALLLSMYANPLLNRAALGLATG